MTGTAPTDSDEKQEIAVEPQPVQAPTRLWRERLGAALRRPYSRDLGICLMFLVIAAWLTHGLWPDPASRALALNPDDQALYEWFLAFDSRVLFGDFGLYTDRLNSPDGVNLLANTSVIGLGILLSPVTVLFGAPVTFALIVPVNVAATAIAWYLLYSRTLGLHRAAAAVGAGVCGFGPAMMSQSNSHLHMTAQWLVPAMIWCVVRLYRASDPEHADYRAGLRRLLTPAVVLAALVSLQVFIGEEVLFLTALTLVVLVLGYALAQPARAAQLAPRFVAGILLATALATVVLAYPLWFQFAGPQHVPNGPFSPAYFSADLASFPAFSPMSLAGTEESARLTTGPAEYNTFLGWPLLLVAVGCVVWLWRKPIVWAIVMASVVMAWLSLGPRIVIDGDRTGIPGLYVLLQGLPVVDGALPMRFAVALVPLIATLLAFALDRALRPDAGQAPPLAPGGRAPGPAPAEQTLRAAQDQRTRRVIVVGAIALALLPIAPKPMPTSERPAVPEFISGGHWRECVEPGGVMVPVPIPTPPAPDTMRWAASTEVAFGTPEGFFIGPYAVGRQASMGTYSQPTSLLIKDVTRGVERGVSDYEREQARQDVKFWQAQCVVLAPDAPNHDMLREALNQLFGPGRKIADAWTWKVG